MKKIKLIGLALLMYFRLFSLDLNWMAVIQSMNDENIFKEINALESSLKSDTKNPENLAKIGLCYHTLAERRHKTASHAIEYLEKSLKIKYDPLFEAFLGSAYSLKAGEKQDLNLLNKGLKIIDSAYQKDPENIHIMILRISNATSKNFPAFAFRSRESIIIKDFTELEDLKNKKIIDEKNYVRIMYLKALYFLKKENLNDAIVIWKEIASKYSDTEWAEKSREFLNTYNKY